MPYRELLLRYGIVVYINTGNGNKNRASINASAKPFTTLVRYMFFTKANSSIP